MESEIEMLRRQISELEDVVAALYCQEDVFWDDLCRIIFEGEGTHIGRKITIDRLKERLNYGGWLEQENKDV